MRQRGGPLDQPWSDTARVMALGVVVLLGCDRDEQQSGTEGPTESVSATASTTSPPGTAPAAEFEFEFVTAPHGASLFWLEQGESQGESNIIELRLDRLGNPITAPVARVQVARNASVSDLTATWVGGHLYLAWLQQSRRDAAVWRFTSSTGEQHRLADAWRAPPHARGNLSLVPRRDHALLMTRGPAHPCADAPAKRCHGFDFHRLKEGDVQSSGVPLDVPVPCESGSAHALSLGARWHYAVCTQQSERDITTVFNIIPKPEYAEAYSVLEGCRPLGMTHWAGGAWLVGDCPDGKRAVSLAHQDAEEVSLHSATLGCSGDRALVEAGSFRLPMEEPRERTELLLHEPNSRVRSLWTGQVHLRAESQGERVSLITQQCRSGALLYEEVSVFRSPNGQRRPAAFVE